MLVAMSNERGEVVVFETADPMELRLAHNLLEVECIPCRVRSGSASALLDVVLGSQAVSFQELLVPADLEERAVGVIDAAWKHRQQDEKA